MTTTPAPTSTPAHPDRQGTGTTPRTGLRYGDDGSLLLAQLFAIMMTGMVIVLTTTMLAAIVKTQTSRDYAIALQAADTAFADATMYANLGRLSETTPTGTVVTRPDGPATTTAGVTWTWAATRTAPRTWRIDVTADGKVVDRKFRATIRGTRVVKAQHETATGLIRYTADRAAGFEPIFLGANTLTATGAPEVDGYNTARGTLASNGPLTLDATRAEKLALWKWTTDTGRCTSTGTDGGACATATRERVRYTNVLDPATITAACTSPRPTWYASTGGLLTAGACYTGLVFDTDRTTFNLTSPVYSTGPVTVATGARVNTTATNLTPSSATLRIGTLSTYTQAKNSRVAAAVHAPNNTCTINGETDTTSATYKTVWMGAAACRDLRINGTARLRADGGLDLVNDSTNATRPLIWNLYNFQILD